VLIGNASDSAGFVTPMPRWVTGFCVTKTPGKLEMQLNVGEIAKSFGYPIDAPLTLTLSGSASGFDQAGRPLVTWQLNQTIGQTFDDVFVDSVSGSLTTALNAVVPTEQQLACGQKRVLLVKLLGLGGPGDRLTVRLQKHLSPGISPSDTFTINEIAMTAVAGLPIEHAVHMRVQAQPGDECVMVRLVEGATVSFQAWVTGLPEGLDASYEWSITGAQVVGPLNTWTVTMVLPSPPTAVTVSVTATVGGIAVTSQSTFSPAGLADAAVLGRLLQMVCRIRGEVVRTWLFDPLDDPLRVSGRESLSKKEIEAMLIAATRLKVMTSEFEAFAKQALQRTGGRNEQNNA
jgi:hypothetical protein